MNEVSPRGALLDAIAAVPDTGQEATAKAGLILRDYGVVPLAMLRARLEQADVGAALQAALGCELPTALQSQQGPHCVLRWLSPDAWLVSMDREHQATVSQAVVTALAGHGALVDVSGAYAVMQLEGPGLQEVLNKSTAYDVHPKAFPAGKVVSTTFAKAAVVLRSLGEEAVELTVRRSFADYTFSWIQAAAEDVGLDIVSVTNQ